MLTGQQNPPNKLVTTDIIEIHYHNVQRTFTYLFPWHVKTK